MFGFAGDDLRWIGPTPRLRLLRIDARRRHSYRLTGIEDSPQIRKLWLYGGVIADTAPLATVGALREVRLTDTKITDVGFDDGRRGRRPVPRPDRPEPRHGAHREPPDLPTRGERDQREVPERPRTFPWTTDPVYLTCTQQVDGRGAGHESPSTRGT